jgi:hypothetical protein
LTQRGNRWLRWARQRPDENRARQILERRPVSICAYNGNHFSLRGAYRPHGTAATGLLILQRT